MIYGPCMCGAYDCRECHPESFTEVSCDCCGAKTVAIDTDDWCEADCDGKGYLFCPVCMDQADEVTCAGCGETTIRYVAEEWETLDGNIYCPDCVENLEEVKHEDAKTR